MPAACSLVGGEHHMTTKINRLMAGYALNAATETGIKPVGHLESDPLGRTPRSEEHEGNAKR